VARLRVKSMSKEQFSRNNKKEKGKKEDRMKIFANFLIDRIIEEQNKAKLTGE
jgi:hypothetical protein